MKRKRNEGGPAFPQHGWTKDPEVLQRMKTQGGMTLRQYYVGCAVTGLLANEWFTDALEKAPKWKRARLVAEQCGKVADELVREVSHGDSGA